MFRIIRVPPYVDKVFYSLKPCFHLVVSAIRSGPSHMQRPRLASFWRYRSIRN